MEQQLFSWTAWDGDLEYVLFYNVILKEPVGQFPTGTKFDSAVLSFQKGTLGNSYEC